MSVDHARKLNGDASLEILDTSGKWVIPEDNEILISKFFSISRGPYSTSQIW